jgi:hypothetical protein
VGLAGCLQRWRLCTVDITPQLVEALLTLSLLHSPGHVPSSSAAQIWEIWRPTLQRPTNDEAARNRRYACIPRLSTGRLRLPPVLTGLAAGGRHGASCGRCAAHSAIGGGQPGPGIGSVKALSRQLDGRCSAKSPCAAPRLVPHVAHQRADARAKSCATAQLCA